MLNRFVKSETKTITYKRTHTSSSNTSTVHYISPLLLIIHTNAAFKSNAFRKSILIVAHVTHSKAKKQEKKKSTIQRIRYAHQKSIQLTLI